MRAMRLYSLVPVCRRVGASCGLEGIDAQIAEDVQLDVDRETDLIAVAQYHVTRQESCGPQPEIVGRIHEDATKFENHRLIASLPIGTIWTTNYDTLLEDAFRNAQNGPTLR